jgi:FtsP/CotA-like multicopper oxidase with cupredoxin domain
LKGLIMSFRRRDIFLKIAAIPAYSPLSPLPASPRYGRDGMFNPGHEYGRIPGSEILAASLDALVYREYLDPHFRVPKTVPLVASDVNEPPWDRRIPGTVLYAWPGERLHIHVQNADPREAHSFHIHGLRYGIESDGAWPFGVRGRDGGRSDAVRPGQSWTYVFDVPPEAVGAWPFHDHCHDVHRSVNRGLFGGLVVRDPSRAPVEHEIPLFIHLLEGLMHEEHVESPPIPPESTFSRRFGDPTGTYDYYCRIHGPAMSGAVTVTAGGPASAAVTMRDNRFEPPSVTIGPGSVVTWTNAEPAGHHRSHIIYFSGSGAPTLCLNGRAFIGNTPTLLAEAGQRLRWYLFNLDLSEQWHNFHPHAARWQLPGADGVATDVRSLSPTEAAVIETVAPPAVRLPPSLTALQELPPEGACRVAVVGDFLFHCHIEEHMMRGLAGLLRSREHLWITAEALAQLPFELPYANDLNPLPPLDFAQDTPPPPHRHHGMSPPDASATTPVPDPTTPVDPAPPTGHSHGGDAEQPPVPADPPGGPPDDAEHPDHYHDPDHPLPAPVHEAATRGFWEVLAWQSPVLPVHAALLHTGKVLLFGGSAQDAAKHDAGKLQSAVWDLATGQFRLAPLPADFFCAGHCFLADGRLLVAGGTRQYLPKSPWYLGLRRAYAFDPILEEWIRLPDMADGRWYPSLIALGDGRILAMGGYREAEDPNDPQPPPMNRVPEIYTPGEGWTTLPANPADWPTYSHLFLLADGTVFYSGGTMGDNSGAFPLIFQPATNTKLKDVPGLQDPYHRDQSASVLLPPAQEQRVMIIGGGVSDDTGHKPSSDKVDIVDLKEANPSYRATASLHTIRMHLNAVLLPDRTVCVCGGGRSSEHDPALEAEIYDPARAEWTRAASATVPRLYHSIALLLPDGRALTGGSNPVAGDEETRLEIFYPPYLFRGPRPIILSAPARGSHGDDIEIETPSAAGVQWIQLIRPAATTHSFDFDQRLIDLTFHRHGACRLHATLPAEPNLAPPGWYMLFLVNDRRIPSVAQWIHLSAK